MTIGATGNRPPALRFGGGGGGGGVSIAFQTEWRDSTGTTDAAYRDGTRFDERNGTLGNGAAEILAPTGLGLATRGNIWRNITNGPHNMTVRKSGVVAESTTFWGRIYLRNRLTATNGYALNHMVAFGGIGLDYPIQFAIGASMTEIFGQWIRTLFFRTLYDSTGAALSYPYTAWTPQTPLDLRPNNFSDAWYLFEWQIEYLTATTYWLRLYISDVDGDGNITNEDVWTNETFFQQDGGAAGTSLDELQGPTVDFGLSTAGLGTESAVRLIVGNESTPATPTNEFIDMASLAISTEGRIRDQVLVF